MTKITGGVISIEDGTKKAEEYAPARKVRVELHFDVPEGEDAQVQIDFVAERANDQVNKLLQRATSDKERLADAAGVGSAAQAAAAAPKPVKQPGPRTTATKPKEPPHPADVLARTAELQTQAREQIAREQAERENPAAVTDDFTADEPVIAISDAELASAASKKAGEIKTPVPIKKLVGEFRPAGHTGQFSLQQIPQERRNEFIERLKKVTI